MNTRSVRDEGEEKEEEKGEMQKEAAILYRIKQNDN